MGLKEEIESKRAEIHSDGYSMSIGELINLYRDEELDIHPEFQRFFRWSREQKSRLVESLLLGIPIPSIFLSQREDGVWDVIDGLQRLSTIFQLVGILRDESGQPVEPLVLTRTKYLPSLEGKKWEDDLDPASGLGREHQLLIKRSKIDLKIVLRESDESSKYELFQRLNTGGSPLSDQELRNCILIMVNRDFYRWLKSLGDDESFNRCIALSDRARDEQYGLELVVRFLVFRAMEESQLSSVGDLGEFLTDRVVELANSPDLNVGAEEEAFRSTFRLLATTLEDDSFRRYDPRRDRFYGGFLISAFEVLALGLGFHHEVYKSSGSQPDIRKVAASIWQSSRFLNGIGSGVRASSRIPVTIPLGRELLKP